MDNKNDDNFRILFEQSPVGSVVVGLDKKFQKCNTAFCRFIGYSEDELIGKSISDITYPEDVNLGMNELKLMVEGKINIASVEKRYVRKDGLIVWGEVSISIVRDSNNEPLYFLPIIQDVTEKKKNEILLKESEEKFRNIFEASNAGKSITFLSGEIRVNRAFCEMLGYSEEELKNKKWQDITFAEDIEATQNEIDSLMKGKRTSTRFIKRFLHKNGSYFWADLSSVIHYNSKHEPLYLITTIIDISEQKIAEQKFKDLMAKHKTFIDTVPDIIMEVDRNKVYTWANKAGYDFFGDDVIGKEASYYFEGQQDTYEKVKPLFQGDEEIIYLESLQKRKDGKTRLLAWWCKVYKDSEGNAVGAVSSARDITDQREFEDKIKKKNKELVEANSVMVGRELKMIELKEEINELLKKCGSEPKY